MQAQRERTGLMDAIILAGGRGRRLGALTRTVPKSAVKFAGLTLLEHCFRRVGEVKEVLDEIYLATSTGGEELLSRLATSCAAMCGIKHVTMLPVEAEARGTFRSFVHALQVGNIKNGCLLIGTDVIVEHLSLRALVEVARENRERNIFLTSPDLLVAPTHGRISANCHGIERYVKYNHPDAPKDRFHSGWSSDIGIRYFSASFIGYCAGMPLDVLADFDDIMPMLVDSRVPFITLETPNRWLHFGASRDFGQMPLDCERP